MGASDSVREAGTDVTRALRAANEATLPGDSVLGLPLTDLRRHLAAARAMRVIQDPRSSARARSIGGLGTGDVAGVLRRGVRWLRGCEQSRWRCRRPALRPHTIHGSLTLDLKSTPEPADLVRWLRDGEPL